MNMIDTLRDKENDNNRKLINKLIDLIEKFNIKDINGLSELEEYFFMVDDKKVDKLDYCINKISHDDYIFELMDSEDIEEMNKLKDLFNEEKDEEKKLYYIIKMFDKAGYDLYLPYTTYKYIMNDQL